MLRQVSCTPLTMGGPATEVAIRYAASAGGIIFWKERSYRNSSDCGCLSVIGAKWWQREPTHGISPHPHPPSHTHAHAHTRTRARAKAYMRQTTVRSQSNEHVLLGTCMHRTESQGSATAFEVTFPYNHVMHARKTSTTPFFCAVEGSAGNRQAAQPAETIDQLASLKQGKTLKQPAAGQETCCLC